MKKKYYIIYYDDLINAETNPAKIFALVESKEVANDWCSNNPNYYYIERKCK